MKIKMSEFKAESLHSFGSGEIDVCSFNGDMAVCTEEFPILITERQAAEFFGLDGNQELINKQSEQIKLLREALKLLTKMSISDQEVLGSEFGGGSKEAEIRANGNMADEILNAESALATTE